MMRLGAAEVSAADVSACQAWRGRDPEHERAWQRAQQISAKLGLIPSIIGLPTLARTHISRRAAIKILTLASASLPATLLALRSEALRTWVADARTATGERRNLTLPDATSVHLNTASALDVRFDDRQRLAILVSGEVLIQTSLDATVPARPFRLQTRHGVLRAIGTRFVVRQEERHTRVAVLDGAVEISPRKSPSGRILNAGKQTRFGDADIEASTTVEPDATDWTLGLLRARHMPLGEFLAELSRYRPGILRCDPAAAGLRISGFYQLSDTDAVLRALTDVLPIRIRRRSDWWVVVEATGA